MSNGSNGERSFSVPYAWLWPAVWAAVLTVGGLVTTYVYATKGELTEHAASEKDERVANDVMDAKVAAELSKEVAVHTKEIEVIAKGIERVERYIEAVHANQATMMIESDIPRRSIRQPKEE